MWIEVNPVRGIEELAGFEDHFTNMLINMPTCGFSWFPMEDKDIHRGGLGCHW
jgi:hypothetical protein